MPFCPSTYVRFSNKFLAISNHGELVTNCNLNISDNEVNISVLYRQNRCLALEMYPTDKFSCKIDLLNFEDLLEIDYCT